MVLVVHWSAVLSSALLFSLQYSALLYFACTVGKGPKFRRQPRLCLIWIALFIPGKSLMPAGNEMGDTQMKLRKQKTSRIDILTNFDVFILKIRYILVLTIACLKQKHFSMVPVKKMTGETPEVRSDKSLTLLTFGPMDQWTNGPMD